MNINKNQALYKALPSSWVAYSYPKSEYKYACKVNAWNTKEIKGINEEIIKKDIVRRAQSFAKSGGIVGEEFSADSISSYRFVEPSMQEGIPDIVCDINPATFYCQTCNEISTEPKAKRLPICKKCNKKKVQLQMVYACECGYIDGVKPNWGGKLMYYPAINPYRFAKEKGGYVEMQIKCPNCSKFLRPKNALDPHLYHAQSGSLVNLYNKEYAETVEKYGSDAEILMLAKWFSIVDDTQFENILKNKVSFFEPNARTVDDPEIQAIAKMMNKTPQEALTMLSATMSDGFSINKVKKDVDAIKPLNTFGDDNLQLITKSLIEYDTLKYPKKLISLDTAIEKNIESESIVEEDEILKTINSMHINNLQVSEQVQIVNYSYGYTRIRSNPESNGSGSRLKMNGFNGKVYTSILETEGILVNLNMPDIYNWLIENKIIEDGLFLETEEDYKKWFMENIQLDSINHFSNIDYKYSKITKVIYSLLHTISHMFIISAGENSGLSKNSISEIIFPNTASIFIYPTSSEGITLGSISGMFETRLNSFLKDAWKNNEVCTFDPVCKTNQNGACIACTYISEVSCSHFNKDLSRSYLYGGIIKCDDQEIVIKKGFWK